jgi:hypothetical protein
MSIGKQIAEQLRRLADGDQALLEAAAENTLLVQNAPLRATLEFSDYDRYSLTLRALTVGAGNSAMDDVRAYLSATAAEIARRLSFLEEPLAVWELDGGERAAQLRSSPPQREGDAVTYWEVTLWAGDEPGARAVRYQWSPGMAEREVLAYPATFALVARMADGLAAALRGNAE